MLNVFVTHNRTEQDGQDRTRTSAQQQDNDSVGVAATGAAASNGALSSHHVRHAKLIHVRGSDARRPPAPPTRAAGAARTGAA